MSPSFQMLSSTPNNEYIETDIVNQWNDPFQFKTKEPKLLKQPQTMEVDGGVHIVTTILYNTRD